MEAGVEGSQFPQSSRGLIFFLIGLIIFHNGPSYAVESLFVNDLVEEALVKNPEILAAKKRWEVSQARVPQAKSPDDPTIGMKVEKIPKGTAKLSRTMPDDRMLSIAQMFPFIGKLSLKGKIALVESQMMAAEYKNTQLKIINDVKKAYYELFMNFKETDLVEQNLKFLESIAKIAEAKYISKEVRQEELLKINLEIAQLSNQIKNLKQERLVNQARLNALLNRSLDSSLGIPNVSEEVTIHQEADELYRLTLENQPELSIFSYAIERNKHAKSLAKKNIFPDVMAEVGLRGLTSGGIGPWDLMLGMTVPLWYWTKQRYEVKEAIANVEEAEAVYISIKNKVLFETNDVFSKVEIAKNKIELYQNNLLPLLENSLYSFLSSFRSGENNVMMILDTQRMLIENKMRYYQALVEYHINVAELERAIGKNLNEVLPDEK